MNAKQINLRLITRAALFAAVIIVVQQFKIQYITGPLVNTTLIFNTLITGVPGAVFLSFLSPALALAQGIMPNAAMFPFIALGNLVYCLIFWRFREKLFYGLIMAPPLKALIIGGGSYFVVGLPLPGAYTIGVSQLLTAFTGATLFFIVWTYIPLFIKDPVNFSKS